MSGIRFAAVATALAVTVLTPIRSATACSCVEQQLSDQVAAASTVFLGTVVTSEPIGAMFEVSRVFKGDGPRDAPVSSGAPGAGISDCAVPFVEGRRYVVFASLQNGTLSTNICAGTTDDLTIVSRLSVASSPSPAAAPPRIVKVVTSRTIPIAAAAAMIALVAAAAVVAVRAGRRPRPVA
jgi:hypothetical protein